jgi:hypothetical protein
MQHNRPSLMDKSTVKKNEILNNLKFLLSNTTGIFFLRMPFRSKSWIMMRTNLFNNNVSQKLVTKRLNHFLQFYLEPDGNQ